MPNPAPEWINDLMWDELLSLAGLPALEGIDTTFKDDLVEVCVSKGGGGADGEGDSEG